MVLPAGADREIVPMFVSCRELTPLIYSKALTLILPVNSLSLLQHIGFQSPHLGSSSAVCLEVAFMYALCLRAAKQRHEQNEGSAWGRSSSGLEVCSWWVSVSLQQVFAQVPRVWPRGNLLASFLACNSEKCILTIESNNNHREASLLPKQKGHCSFNHSKQTN